jgi:hypothetical protein
MIPGDRLAVRCEHEHRCDALTGVLPGLVAKVTVERFDSGEERPPVMLRT